MSQQLSEWFGSNEVAQFLTKHEKNIEVELSFGKWVKTDRHQRFEPGVTKSEFYNLFESLDQIVKKSPELFRREDIHTLEETTKAVAGQRGANIRRIKNLATGEISFLMKDRSKVWDERNWGLRFALSREEELGVVPNFKASGFREKQRTRFVFVGEKSAFKGLTVDMTKVVKSSFRDGVVFEVEVEKDSSVPKTAAAMTNSVKRILEMMQSKSSCQTNEIISTKEKEIALEMFGRLMGSKRYGDTSFLNKPRQVKVDDLFEPKLFAVTNKLDGERRLLWFSSLGTYLVNPPFDIQKIAGVFFQYKDTVLDVEFYGQDMGDCSCYAFDCLFFSGQSQYHKNFDTRFSHVLEIEESVGQEAKVIAKKYFEVSVPLGSFEGLPTATKDTRKVYLEKARTGKLGGDLLREAVDKALDYAEKQKFRTDGLVLQPREQGYKNEDTLKWKPGHQITIDFRLRRKAKNEFFLMMGGSKDREIKFEGTAAKRIPGTVVLPKEFLDSHPGHDFEGEILEFGFDKTKSIFVPHRVRTDKDVPNYIKTVLSVWGDIFKGVSLETLRGKTLALPRRYNNILKQCLLGTSPGAKTDLDIGSGRGGDIQKWREGGFKMVWNIEPNEENIKEFESRARAAKFSSYKLLHAKAQETQKALKFFGDDKVDMASAFYCLGYFAETKKSIEELCETISSLSKVGALAVFSFMDGQEIRNLLGKKKKFENSAFSLEKDGEWTNKKYGNVIKVHIKDDDSMVKYQKEWLVDLEMLQDAMKKHGYDLLFSRLADEGVSFLSTEGFEFVSLHRVATFRKIE